MEIPFTVCPRPNQNDREVGKGTLSALKSSPALCVLQSPRLGAFALNKEKCKTQSRQAAEEIFMVSG
jgi:hypothetical protein